VKLGYVYVIELNETRPDGLTPFLIRSQNTDIELNRWKVKVLLAS